MSKPDPLVLGTHTFDSRLLVGTGKYASVEQTEAAIDASGAEIVTVALRRVDLTQRGEGSLMGLLQRRAKLRESPAESAGAQRPAESADAIGKKKWTLLPNTAGCYTADEAVRTLRLARELGLAELVKLEVIGDKRTLFPDNEETLAAARILVKEGFAVLPYCSDDPVLCKKLEDLGCVAVMPLAAPIGSGLGIQNRHNLDLIVEAATIPVLVDAGVGTASDAAIAMELGCDGVLLNTAIAEARDPIAMAEAMREAVSAGRKAYRAGRMPKRRHASASSPTEGLSPAARP